MAGTTALMFLDFGWFREQVCMVACPYGRLQSVLLDRRSLIVGYDDRRGEPRGHLARRSGNLIGESAAGDCVDCGACVVTCPTGIDIRDGLQMECIHCTQCMDACDSVMDRIGRPRGLIRYSSRDELGGAPRRILRPRLVLYPMLLLAVWGLLGWSLAHRESADITVLRGVGSPFTLLPSGEVSNQIRIKIVNRAAGDHLIAPDNPVAVSTGHAVTATVFVTAARHAFQAGAREIRFVVSDGLDFSASMPYRLLGPEESRP
jgi:cytochrome c oxidase accessory protein FixG